MPEKKKTLKDLLKMAWQARNNAYPWKSGTKVGCAILTEGGLIKTGWNIEGLWMTSIHAEIVAISQIVVTKQKIKTIVVVAETKMFTPCGACLDWLFQFATKDTMVIIDNHKEIKEFHLNELMPHYPIQ